jgi:hypothetical protein
MQESISKDLDALAAGVEARAALDIHLTTTMKSLPMGKTPGSKRLTQGTCKGLIELRFAWQNVQYRPLGYTIENYGFVFLMMAREIGNDWKPPDACKEAHRRKREIDGKPDRIRLYDFGDAPKDRRGAQAKQEVPRRIR